MSEDEDDKRIITPGMCADHDAEQYNVQIEMPGVKKEDVELVVNEQSLCVKGARKDADFHACYRLAHEIIVDEVEASFDNGLLTISMPLKHSLAGRKIAIK